MLTLPVEEWIGNAAAVLSGVWGAVTQRSEQSGYSRPAIYQHAERVVQAVANEQAGGISDEGLWTENERLKAENEALWQAWSEVEELSESKQRELASAGSAMGLSLSQMVILLAIVLPSRLVPSRATVGRWVQQSAQQSRGILKVLDRACQGFVLVLCLDEIFFHQQPVLVGVEPQSMAWVLGQRAADRCRVRGNRAEPAAALDGGASGTARRRAQDGQRRARQRLRRPGHHRRHPLRPAGPSIRLDRRHRRGQGTSARPRRDAPTFIRRGKQAHGGGAR